MKMYFNPVTEKRLSRLRADLPASLILCGEEGIGLASTARFLANKRLVAWLEPLGQNDIPNRLTGTIGIGKIRELYDLTRGVSSEQRVVVVDDADRLSRSAQAAFLKLAEEPSPSTRFILTTHHPELLSETLRSRFQVERLRPLTDKQVADLFAALGVREPSTKEKIMFLANGLPAEITRLALDSDYLARRSRFMNDARAMLTAPTYDRLITLNGYQNDHEGSLNLIDAMLVILRRSLSAKAQPEIIQKLDTLLDIRQKIAGNANPRLQLLAAML